MSTVTTIKHDVYTISAPYTNTSRLLYWDDLYLCQSFWTTTGEYRFLVSMTNVSTLDQKVFTFDKPGNYQISNGPIYHDGYLYQCIREPNSQVVLVKIDVSDGSYTETIIRSGSHQQNPFAEPFKNNGFLYFPISSSSSNYTTIIRYDPSNGSFASIGSGQLDGWTIIHNGFVYGQIGKFDLDTETFSTSATVSLGQFYHNVKESFLLGNTIICAFYLNPTITIRDLDTRSVVSQGTIPVFNNPGRLLPQCLGSDGLLYIEGGSTTNFCYNPSDNTGLSFTIPNRTGAALTACQIHGDIWLLQSGR